MTRDGPTRRVRFWPASVRVAVPALVAGAAWWGLGPVHLPFSVPDPVSPTSAATGPTPTPTEQFELAAWDILAFKTPIWVAAPEAPPEPAAVTVALPPPPPPRNLQLLAIVRQDDRYRAVLYDQDLDRLFTVSTGEALSGRTVLEIDRLSITLGDGPALTRLVLDPGQPQGPRGSIPSGGLTP